MFRKILNWIVRAYLGTRGGVFDIIAIDMVSLSTVRALDLERTVVLPPFKLFLSERKGSFEDFNVSSVGDIVVKHLKRVECHCYLK